MHWSLSNAKGQVPKQGLKSHTATVVGTKIFVFGGCDAGDNFNDLLVFDTEIQYWYTPTVQGDIPPSHRAHSATLVGTKLFVFGGGDGPNYFRDLYILDTKTFVWTKPAVNGKLPDARRAHTADLIGNKIFVFGGGDGKQALNDVFTLDTETLTWNPVRTIGPTAPKRGYQKSFVFGSKLFILGGSDGQDCFKDISVLDTTTSTWTKSPFPGVGLLAHAVQVLGTGQVIVFGGHTSVQYTNTLRLFDLKSGHWTEPATTGLAPEPRAYHSICLCDHRMWVIGGYDNTTCFPDVHILDLGLSVMREKKAHPDMHHSKTV